MFWNIERDAKLRDHHVLGINELKEWAATQSIDAIKKLPG